MAELVDATDSKSVGHCGCVGSSPTPGTLPPCIDFALFDASESQDWSELSVAMYGGLDT